mgnify:CR=1 FL=1
MNKRWAKSTEYRAVDLGGEREGKLLFRLALPAIAAQVINLLYNLVDRMYIGHLPEIGSAALSGVGVNLPVILAVTAFSLLFSSGGAARASMMMGKKKKEAAERIMGNCAAALILAGMALTILLQISGREILMLFGASSHTIEYAWEYLQLYSLGTVFVQISLGLNNFINAQGYTLMGMLTVLIGAGANIVLDPIFMFGLGMGVRGAALATVISQGLSAAWILSFLCSGRSFLRLKLCRMKISARVLGPCILLGTAPFVMEFTESILNICFNVSMKAYGGDLAVGVMAVLSSIMQFALLPVIGMTQGAQPIVSYNLGAGHLERVRKTFLLLLKSCLTYTAGLWLLIQLFPQLFMRMFSPDEAYIAMGTWAMRIFGAGICILGLQNACQQTFVALGNARSSLWMALLRKVFLLIPLIFLLPHLFRTQPVAAVLLAEPAADVTASVVTAFLFFRFLKRILRQGEHPAAGSAGKERRQV